MGTIFDGKTLFETISRKEQKGGITVFRAKHHFEEERGLSDAEIEKARNEKLRQYSKNRLEGDLQLEGYILLGWYLGHPKEECYVNWSKSKKYGFTSEPGMAAFYPITGARWVYIWKTHGRYAPHPDPVWEDERWTHFVENDVKPKRIATKKMMELFALPKKEPFGCSPHKNSWMPSVPLWLLSEDSDMRPLYLAGGEPKA